LNKEQVKHYCIQQVKQGDWIDMSGHSCRDCKFYDTIFPFDVIWTGSEYLKWLVEYGN